MIAFLWEAEVACASVLTLGKAAHTPRQRDLVASGWSPGISNAEVNTHTVYHCRLLLCYYQYVIVEAIIR